MHIGLIGGIGPAATEFYYRGLVRAQAAGDFRLDLTIVHADVGTLLRNLLAGETRKQADIFADLIGRLAGAGAEIAAITALAGHFCLEDLIPLSPLRVESAIAALDAHLNDTGYSRVGLLGTAAVMRSKLYGGIGGTEIVVPAGDELDAVHEAYAEMAGAGKVSEERRAFFFDIGSRLCSEQGAEAVILGGTDLFLAFGNRDCGFPTIDAAQVHIDRLAALASR